MDSSTLFYTSLIRQNPKSEMAMKWCMKNKMQKYAQKHGNKQLYKSVLKDLDKTKKTKKTKKTNQEVNQIEIVKKVAGLKINDHKKTKEDKKKTKKLK